MTTRRNGRLPSRKLLMRCPDGWMVFGEVVDAGQGKGRRQEGRAEEEGEEMAIKMNSSMVHDTKP